MKKMSFLFLTALLTALPPVFAAAESPVNEPTAEEWMMDVTYPGLNVSPEKKVIELHRQRESIKQIKTEKTTTKNKPAVKITCVVVHDPKKKTVTCMDFVSNEHVKLRKLLKAHNDHGEHTPTR
ncbi:MAG: hypothetical protein K2W82_05635 [Candidatus Obscuribacterales bacterium]|nr:hypothetical protein [Candidatus Obscuribacterales bacterium]